MQACKSMAGTKACIWEVSGTRKRVRYNETDDGVIVFKTIKDGSYMVGIKVLKGY